MGGVRRFQNADGTLTEAGKSRYGDARKENKRILKKKKKLTEGHPSKETQDVVTRYHDELASTEEGKAYSELSKRVEEIRQEIEKQYGTKEPYIRFDPDTAKWVKTTLDQYNKKSDTLWKEKYEDEYASRVLKDLDYDDTQEGRDYLKRMGI